MEQRIVLQEADRYIYYIKENHCSFYMIIPRSSMVNLVIKMIGYVDDEKVKSVVPHLNKVIIIPVIDANLLSSVQQNSLESFNAVDAAFSIIVNLSHQILTYNHVQVDTTVYFDECAEYATFQSWFIQKYEGRVVPIKLVSEQPLTTDDSALDVASNVVEDSNEKDDAVFEQSDLPSNRDFGFVSYVLLGVVVAVISLVFLYLII